MKTRLALLGFLLTLALTAAPAHATLYCVSSLSGFQSALDSAASNAQDDEFRFQSGTFLVEQQLFLDVSDQHSIAFSGGWGSACNAEDAGATILDGQGAHGILFITAINGFDISIRRITFQNALSSYEHGGALWVVAVGDVTIDLCRFFNNRHSVAGGALFAGAYATLRIRNNLFFANQAYEFGGAELVGFLDGNSAFVTNNTVIGNSATNTAANGGIWISGEAHFTLSNNILWSNYGADVVNTGAATFLNNDVGVVAGNPPDAASQSNLAIAPTFAGGLFNFRLAPGSALTDVGTDTPPGGLTAVDLDGNPRLQLPHVDLGAYETASVVIFRNGFE